MKNLNEYITEFLGAETRKYHIDRECKSNIIVWDTENATISHFFKDISGAQKYADDYDKISRATKKIIKSADHNLRYIVIDFDNLSKEAQDCIDMWDKEVEKDYILNLFNDEKNKK